MDQTSVTAAGAIDTFLVLLIGIGPKLALIPFLEITTSLDPATKRSGECHSFSCLPLRVSEVAIRHRAGCVARSAPFSIGWHRVTDITHGGRDKPVITVSPRPCGAGYRRKTGGRAGPAARYRAAVMPAGAGWHAGRGAIAADSGRRTWFAFAKSGGSRALPADRRPISCPFNLCSYLLRRSYFRDCHETDAYNCVEVASLCPLGQGVSGRVRVWMSTTRQYVCTIYHVILFQGLRESICG